VLSFQTHPYQYILKTSKTALTKHEEEDDDEEEEENKLNKLLSVESWYVTANSNSTSAPLFHHAHVFFSHSHASSFWGPRFLESGLKENTDIRLNQPRYTNNVSASKQRPDR